VLTRVPSLSVEPIFLENDEVSFELLERGIDKAGRSVSPLPSHLIRPTYSRSRLQVRSAAYPNPLPTHAQVYLKPKEERDMYYDEEEHERKLALRRLSRAREEQQEGEGVYFNPMFKSAEEEKITELEEEVANYMPANGGA